MPVTIQTHLLEAETWPKSTTADATQVLSESCSISKVPMQSSLDASSSTVTPTKNGLVDAAIAAWNNHHHLVLRPDDVWLAVVSQLGFFINAHAEELRDFFVAHEGKKELSVSQNTHPDTADYAAFATQMAAEIAKNVNDPDLVPWVIPDFSTTTDTDRVAGAVLLMGALQHYFSYIFICCTCGIPSVTLLGERADWVALQERIERIPRLGGEAVEFHQRLRPLARHMVLSFDEPASEAVRDFWRVIASWEKPQFFMSGGPGLYLSGWITAFCFWTAEGKRNYGDNLNVSYHPCHYLDGVQYPALDPKDTVPGYGSVPVNVRWYDNGVLIEERKCRVVAGSIAIRPGRPADLGVDLASAAPLLPQLDEKDKEKGRDRAENPYDPFAMPAPGSETVEQRRFRWVQQPTKRASDAPPASEGLSAVQPYIAWWIYEDKPRTTLEPPRW